MKLGSVKYLTGESEFMFLFLCLCILCSKDFVLPTVANQLDHRSKKRIDHRRKQRGEAGKNDQTQYKYVYFILGQMFSIDDYGQMTLKEI